MRHTFLSLLGAIWILGAACVKVSEDTDVQDTDIRGGAFDDLAAVIEQKMNEAHIPGIAVAVTRPGEVVWTGAFGWANIDASRKATVDTPFMLASVSKTVTGVAVMQAVEKDVLSLDVDINTVLPFTVDNPRVDGETILLRHLVSHTSGIRDNWNNMPYADGDSTLALGRFLEGYLVDGGDWYSANNNFYKTMPGTAFEYGNIATAVAGYAVEAATNVPFDEYCDMHIFDALEMKHTGWHLADFDEATVAMPYAYTDGAYEAYGHYGFPDYPNGQLRSSVSDMARFLAAVSNDGSIGDARILQGDTNTALLTAPVPEVDTNQFVFWYGSNRAERAVVGHNGGESGVATEMFFSPESGVGIIVLMNAGWDDAVGDAATAIQKLLFDRAESLE